ncbi:T9SS type A sorting domain-containing protein [Halocola ammonii]
MRLFFTLLISLLALNASSQDFWEVPPEGSVYTYYETFWGQDAPPLHYTWEGTVTADGHTWRELFAPYSPNDTDGPTHLIRAQDGIWFLKTPEWSSSELAEYPLYDWNAEEGDTIMSASLDQLDLGIVRLKVDSIHLQTFLDGSERKVFHLSNIDFDVNQEIMWIEGIGMINDHFQNAAGTSIADAGSRLICAHFDLMWVYEAEFSENIPKYNECDWVPISVDEKNQTTFSIHPNPADQSIHLDFENPQKTESLQISIFDLQGREVKSVQITTVGEAEISVDEIPNGVYLLKLSGDQFSHTQRLVVRH